MTVEIEAKFRVDSHEAVREGLRARGALFVERVIEANHILDRADRALRRDGCGLRVRIKTPISSDSRLSDPTPKESGHPPCQIDNVTEPQASARTNLANATSATLTFKGPRQDGAFKSREELEIEVNDGENMIAILRRLGFQAVLWYEKRRESWRLGDCRVELDEPPEIGFFVEIEGPNEQSIQAVQHDLFLPDEDLVRESYVQLLSDYCRQQGIADRRLPLRS